MLNTKQIAELLHNPDKHTELIALSVEDLYEMIVQAMIYKTEQETECQIEEWQELNIRDYEVIGFLEELQRDK